MHYLMKIRPLDEDHSFKINIKNNLTNLITQVIFTSELGSIV